MADLLKQGADWLSGQRHAHMASEVTYEREGSDPVTLSATTGRTLFEQADESGLKTEVESRDFLIRSEDLVIGGEQAEPQPGDRITYTVGAKTYGYEVASPGGAAVWRWSGLPGGTMRVHTKFVAEGDTP